MSFQCMISDSMKSLCFGLGLLATKIKGKVPLWNFWCPHTAFLAEVKGKATTSDRQTPKILLSVFCLEWIHFEHYGLLILGEFLYHHCRGSGLFLRYDLYTAYHIISYIAIWSMHGCQYFISPNSFLWEFPALRDEQSNKLLYHFPSRCTSHPQSPASIKRYKT